MPPSGFSPAPVEELQLRPGSSCFRDPGGSSEAGGFGVSGKAEAGHVHQAVCHGRGGEQVAMRGRQTPASRLQGLWAHVDDCVHAWCCSARPGGGAAGRDGPPRGRRLSGPTPPPPPTRTGAGAGSGPHACSSSDWAVGSGRAAIVSSAPGAVQGSAALRPVQPEAWACVCGALGVGGDLMTTVAPRATRPASSSPRPPCPAPQWLEHWGCSVAVGGLALHAG